MQSQTIPNTKAAFGFTSPVEIPGDGCYTITKNTSGATLNPGTVLVSQDATGQNVTFGGGTLKFIIGVSAVWTVPPAGDVLTQVRGACRINIAANVVATGDVLTLSPGNPGAAQTNNALPANNAVSALAIALEPSTSADVNNTIHCRLVL